MEASPRDMTELELNQLDELIEFAEEEVKASEEAEKATRAENLSGGADVGNLLRAYRLRF
tara:strand:+ start:268 stop:447 length:180 start_codon:yes stop_codon:yes gene_type:complete